MIIDASALLALLFREPDAPRYADAMAGASRLRMSAVSWFEAAMAIDRRGDAIARTGFDAFLQRYGIEVEALTASHALAARQAWRDFGKGKHAADLNFGGCLTYGFAKVEREPLLFKGDDVSRTDIEPALRP